MTQSPSPRQKLSAIGTLLWELVLLTFATALSLILLGIAGNVVAHFLLGYSWAWEKGHVADWLLFCVLVATPLLLLGGLVWIMLRDEYQRILQMRIRKW